jgi:hypothetical protein
VQSLTYKLVQFSQSLDSIERALLIIRKEARSWRLLFPSQYSRSVS